MPSFAQVAQMATAVDAVFDQRFAAALMANTVSILSAARPADADVSTQVQASRRRSYAFAVMKDPVGQARGARWALAAAAPALCDTYNAQGQSAISDAQLSAVAAAMWDALAEA